MTQGCSAKDTRRGGYWCHLARACASVFLILSVCGCGFTGSREQPQKKENAPEDVVAENPLPYTVHFDVRDEDGVKSGGRYLAGRMKDASQLERLKKRPPDGSLGLERRARQDIETARKLMRSEGFYDGRAELSITGQETGKASVSLTLVPGPRYAIGDISTLYSRGPRIPRELADRARAVFPTSGIPGLEKGKPAAASEVLGCVSDLVKSMHEQGFPDARLLEQHYYIDRKQKTLNAVLYVDPGEAAMLGNVSVTSKSDVSPSYIARLAPWEPGQEFWDSRRVDEYIVKLRKTGLFKSVTPVVVPERLGGRNNTVSWKTVGVKVEDAKHRSVGGMVRYETDTGFGVEADWEHRNLFHNGEKLTLQAPVTETSKGLKARFSKPEFMAHGQSLLFSGSALQEKTEAYDRSGISVSGGVERQISRAWYVYAGVGVDSGELKSNTTSRQGYSVYGGELKVRRDTRSDVFNPVSGTTVEVGVEPLTGEYDGGFSALGTRFAATGYYAPFTKDGAPDDRVVLAGRAEAGAFFGAPLHALPPSQRYYLGGAGTVRGYGYQQIGPMDDEDEPLGARSYQLVNLESRFRVSRELGVVTFVDGGRAYKDQMPHFDPDMDYAAGAGIRYFTPIGPIRFDVAVPLKQTGQLLQFYISIGQAF